MHPMIILCLILIALAMPPALERRSWKRFFICVILSFIGVVLPLFVFFFSGFLVPEWKGGCPHGWLDCFHVGKLALTPLVLVATAALYAEDIARSKNEVGWCVAMCFLTGAVVSSVCLVVGLVIQKIGFDRMHAWLLVPSYVSVWYSIRTIQLIKAAKPGFKVYAATFLISLPFWIGSVLWSKKYYLSLPDKAPDCFVVTAAMRGHPFLVGPFREINRRNHVCRANQQLATLWQFENAWRIRAPKSHAIFRRAYNRIGPIIAARIQSPWPADLTFIAIKPVELVARLINRNAKERYELRQMD
jgi:hypothetical protein